MIWTIISSCVIFIGVSSDPSTPMNPDTLRSMAEASLAQDNLGPDSFQSSLWEATLQRAEKIITLNHQIRQLQADVSDLRTQLESLQQFIKDHKQFGQDFEKYEAVLSETRKLTDAQRALKRQQERIEMARKRELWRQQQQNANQTSGAKRSQNRKLNQLGFSPIGQDVWLSKSAYVYASQTVPEQRTYLQPGPGGTVQQVTSIEQREEMDYTEMTISGSLLNAAAEVRNIGVAFAFRDSFGNQIGQETVIIEYARPDVPYPFTAELKMASDQPFASTTQWVLFADPSPPAPPVTTPTNPPTNTAPSPSPAGAP